MFRTIKGFLPVAALAMAALVGGCIVVPEPGYRHHYYGPGWGWGGWRR